MSEDGVEGGDESPQPELQRLPTSVVLAGPRVSHCCADTILYKDNKINKKEIGLIVN